MFVAACLPCKQCRLVAARGSDVFFFGGRTYPTGTLTWTSVFSFGETIHRTVPFALKKDAARRLKKRKDRQEPAFNGELFSYGRGSKSKSYPH